MSRITEWIEFEKVALRTKLAPLVVPMAQGRPDYTKPMPAYVKPK